MTKSSKRKWMKTNSCGCLLMEQKKRTKVLPLSEESIFFPFSSTRRACGFLKPFYQIQFSCLSCVYWNKSVARLFFLDAKVQKKAENRMAFLKKYSKKQYFLDNNQGVEYNYLLYEGKKGEIIPIWKETSQYLRYNGCGRLLRWHLCCQKPLPWTWAFCPRWQWELLLHGWCRPALLGARVRRR